MKKTGFTNIAQYRKKGLIVPHGYGVAGAGLSAFYEKQEIEELKKKLGITIDKTDGLISEDQLKEKSGLTRIHTYRKKGIIQPKGYAMTSNGVRAFYELNQTKKLRAKLGITLGNTKGLLNEKQFAEVAKLTNIAKYRKDGLINPVGFGVTNAGVSPFYRVKQIKELKKKLGITLSYTRGLLNENQFIKMAKLTNLARYRKNGLIKPVGFGVTNAGVGPFYRVKQIKKLRKKLGITIENTKGLLNENQFKRQSGLSKIGEYRKKGLIIPVGYAMAGSNLSAFYNVKQIKQLKERMGITLSNTKGLLTEKQIKTQYGIQKINEYREKGVIKPVGYGMSNSGVSPFYHTKQIKKLKEKLEKIKR